jgi:hypothetical protein
MHGMAATRLAERDAKKAGLKAGRKEAGLRPPIPLPNKNIENNPMQRKEPLEKTGVAARVLPAKKHFDTSGKSPAHLQHPRNLLTARKRLAPAKWSMKGCADPGRFRCGCT